MTAASAVGERGHDAECAEAKVSLEFWAWMRHREGRRKVSHLVVGGRCQDAGRAEEEDSPKVGGHERGTVGV